MHSYADQLQSQIQTKLLIKITYRCGLQPMYFISNHEQMNDFVWSSFSKFLHKFSKQILNGSTSVRLYSVTFFNDATWHLLKSWNNYFLLQIGPTVHVYLMISIINNESSSFFVLAAFQLVSCLLLLDSKIKSVFYSPLQYVRNPCIRRIFVSTSFLWKCKIVTEKDKCQQIR